MRNLTATFCLTIAVFLGNTGISWSADFQTGVAAYERRDYATALSEWTPLADQGNADAQGRLGEMYRQGAGVRQNNKTAVFWFRRAAEQGDIFAQVKLGGMYADGNGVAQDYVYAYMWWHIAATSLDRTALRSKKSIEGKLSKVQLERAEALVRECARKRYKGC
ncbi:MAG: tetratricopeptide repeat protein [Alphaproteobacteria bacterium]